MEINYINKEKEEIIEEILEKKLIQVGQLIDYAYFLFLYEPYRDKMREQDFASVLGLSYINHNDMKNKGSKARVLKDRIQKIAVETKKEMIRELLDSKIIQPGQSINYTEFLSLYGPYRTRISEQEFASILEISYGNHNSMKNRGTRAKVLKSKKEKTIGEQKQEIIRELSDCKGIYPGQSIDYTEFLSLYELYRDKMSEQEFANVLNITYRNYRNLKNQGTRTKILKNTIQKVTKQEKEQITKELLESKQVQAGQLINYEQFLSLYETYKDRMSEQEFAIILGINYISYRNIKNKGSRTKILKAKTIIEEEKEEIIRQLIESKNLRVGQLINYTEFLSLYEPYRDRMGEKEFASILGITDVNYNNIKNKREKTRILKDRKEQLTEEVKEAIAKTIVENKSLRVGQLIHYTEFLSLYEPYRNRMSEQQFAEILGISSNSYVGIKYRGTRTKILRYRKMTAEEKSKIVNQLIESKQIQPGQLINYVQFLSLYEAYKSEISEQGFAQILGINYSDYINMKSRGIKAKIDYYRIKAKTERIKYILSREKRYYSKSEIEEISEKYDLPINLIMQYMFCGGKEEYVLSYLSVLNEKGQLWIGKSKCSEEFANKHSEAILREAQILSRKLCSKYRCRNIQEDILGNAIIYILEECGDVEKNFGDKTDEVIHEILSRKMNLYMKYRCITSKRLKECSFQVRYRSHVNDGKLVERQLKDERVNVQAEVEENILSENTAQNPEERCIQVLMHYVELGLERTEALRMTGEKLGLNPKEMLHALEKYMLNKKLAKETSTGEYVIGE